MPFPRYKSVCEHPDTLVRSYVSIGRIRDVLMTDPGTKHITLHGLTLHKHVDDVVTLFCSTDKSQWLMFATDMNAALEMTLKYQPDDWVLLDKESAIWTKHLRTKVINRCIKRGDANERDWAFPRWFYLSRRELQIRTMYDNGTPAQRAEAAHHALLSGIELNKTATYLI
jgi:hypothetical protein